MDEEEDKRDALNKSRGSNKNSNTDVAPFSPVKEDDEHDHHSEEEGSSSTSGDETGEECEEDDEDKKALEEYRVADIHFAFHNAKLVKLLFERGEAIKDIDRERRAEIEEKMNKDIFRNLGEVQKLNKISSAFITFNETSAHDKALDIKKHECKLMHQHIKFTEPPEPTNVQWENKQLSKHDVKNNII